MSTNRAEKISKPLPFLTDVWAKWGTVVAELRSFPEKIVLLSAVKQ